MTNPPSPYINSDPTKIAPVAPSAPVDVHPKVIAKSTSVWGGVIAVVGYVLQPQVLAVLPEKVSGIVMALGAILSIFGFRNAISKNGTGQCIMAALISKREAVILLRRVAQKGITEEDSKSLRVYAAQLQREIENHYKVARESRDRRKMLINNLITGFHNG
jgi:predicted membrane-bound spermidine synthase